MELLNARHPLITTSLWVKDGSWPVPNIGILASFDPVALDMACADMVNQAATIPGSVADIEGDEDVFTRIHPNTKWKVTIDQAVKMGMGTTEYEIVRMK